MVNQVPICGLTKSVDVGVVDLGAEEAFGGNHGVVIRQEELEVEHATFVGRVGGAGNLHEEVTAVGLGRLCVDADDCTKQIKQLLESSSFKSRYSFDCRAKIKPVKKSFHASGGKSEKLPQKRS